MLGYTLDNLTSMADAVQDAINSNRLADDVTEKLEMTLDVLQGLEAEGYFD